MDAKGQETDYFYASNRLILTLQYPQGKSNWRYYCNHVAYAYDGTVPNGSTFQASYSAGRLTTKFYGNSRQAPTASPASYLTSGVPGYLETYAYHPAGGVTDKEFAVGAYYPGTNWPDGALATLDVSYTYNSAGQVATVSYPTVGSPQDPTTYLYTPTTFTYAYDTMARPTSLQVGGYGNSTFPNGYNMVQNVTYDYAGRMSSLWYWGTTESKTWNVSGQLASLSWTGGGGTTGSLTYSYSATQNNGQITQVVDTVSGETISYQYDQLKRLVSASSTPNSGSTPAAWTQTFQYDGFGNLTAKTLNGTTTPIAVNAATNQLTNAYYDANGNMTSGTGSTFTYDVSNRIATATATSGGLETYEYAPDNKRIHRTLNGVDEWTFYGAQGEKLGVYTLSSGYDGNGNPVAFFVPARTSVWFAGKLIYENGPVNLDRLGTNRASGARFLPFGEELTSTSNDRTKFGTYNRDSYTGLDYADQRFYASTYGRFNTPDPGYAGGLDNPTSLNRYAYVLGDPVNGRDPSGLCAIIGSGLTQSPYTYSTSKQEEFANEVGGISVAPYSNGTIPGGVANVLAQGLGIATGATLNWLTAISVAAQTPGPINIFAFSGSGGAFTNAYNMLTPDIQSRIASITYIDPGNAIQSLASGKPGTTVYYYTDRSDLNNLLVQIFGNAPGGNVNFVDTGTCGHDENCVIQRFAGQLSQTASQCSVGAGAVVGEPSFDRSGGIGGNGFGLNLFGQPFWIVAPEPVPDVTEKIHFDQ